MPDRETCERIFLEADREADALLLADGFEPVMCCLLDPWLRERLPNLYLKIGNCFRGWEKMDGQTFGATIETWKGLYVEAVKAYHGRGVAARELAPLWLAPLSAKKYRGEVDAFEVAVARLAGWAASSNGHGGPVSWGEFWRWFEAEQPGVFAKLGTLEAETESAFTGGPGKDTGELTRKWSETIRWAVTEFTVSVTQAA